MRTINQPPYSPDLNPLDFSLWAAIEKKALSRVPKGRVTIAKYKALLRKEALRMPKAQVQKAVEAIKGRAQAIFQENGRHIKRD